MVVVCEEVSVVMRVGWIGLVISVGLMACASDPLPESLNDYVTSETCVVLNLDPIPPDSHVPHPGYKTVYACHDQPEIFFEDEQWIGTPYPDGTMIIKESCMDAGCGEVEDDFVFLVATAEKISGAWQWHEYTRNFDYEELLEVPFPESSCIGCHEDVAAADYMFTGYEAR
jgi:hypothetical protein